MVTPATVTVSEDESVPESPCDDTRLLEEELGLDALTNEEVFDIMHAHDHGDDSVVAEHIGRASRLGMDVGQEFEIETILTSD